MGKHDIVIYADETTGVHPLKRERDNQPARSCHGKMAETTYSREGTIIYPAGLFVHGGEVYGHGVDRNTQKNFKGLVEEITLSPRCQKADRVFWIIDHGSPNHPATFSEWLEKPYPKAVCAQLSTHSSWLTQIEL